MIFNAKTSYLKKIRACGAPLEIAALRAARLNF